MAIESPELVYSQKTSSGRKSDRRHSILSGKDHQLVSSVTTDGNVRQSITSIGSKMADKI